MQYWLYLALAIVFEVAGTTSMKLSDGFSKLLPSLMMVVFYSLSFGALTMALKRFDVSLAYAVWSGLGTCLIAVVGILYFHESVSVLKVVSIGFIVAGVIGVNLAGSVH